MFKSNNEDDAYGNGVDIAPADPEPDYVNFYVFITLLCIQYSIIVYIHYSAGVFKYTRIY